MTAPSLDSSRAAVRAAAAGADRAWLGVLPRLELSARYTRLSDVENPSLGGDFDRSALDPVIAGVDDPEARALFEGLFESFGSFDFPVILDQYSLRASLTYPVSDVFLTILPAYRASSSFADAQRLRTEAEQQTVELRAREAFYLYARARGALLVAEATVQQIDAHRRNVEALVNAGVAAPVDLMRVDAQLASARVGVARARGGVTVAAQALRNLMHVEGEEPLIPVGENLLSVPPPVEAPRAQLVARAIENRAEMRALRLVITGRESAVTARRGEQWPHLALQANYEYANPNNRIIPQQEEWNGTWDVSVLLTWSPNDFFAGDAAVDQAQAELAQSRADLDALGDAVELEVIRAHDGYETARAALEAAQAGIAAAEESYRVRGEQIRAGTAVTSDLIDAETELTRARLQLLDALIDVHLARARLERAIGR